MAENKKVYCLKVSKAWNDLGDIDWSIANLANISYYPWAENTFRPKAFVKLLGGKEGLAVCMYAKETKIRTQVIAQNGPVCRDSCLEFFINFDPDHVEEYMNFEINPIGTLHLGFGKDRYQRELIEIKDYKTFFQIQPVVISDFGWYVMLVIPYHFIRNFYPEFQPDPDKLLRGNFYKCGDETDNPHYGCWNPVISKTPDFHRPECFGTIYLC